MFVFAGLAFICFLLDLFHVHLGSIDLVVLGLMFVALHLLWEPAAGLWRGRQRA
jgi:hypothetical protein